MTTHSAPTDFAVHAQPRPRRPRFLPGPPTVYDAIDEIQLILEQVKGDDNRRHILEAGCGSVGYFTFTANDHITGVDTSESQLMRNEVLHEKVHGDIQSYPLPFKHYDIIVCWYVLEHVPDPKRALLNMMSALRDGGVLVIAVPSVTSLKGLITKWTPHWFHVFVHRHLFKRHDAGQEGHPPFPTYLRWCIRQRAIERLAAAHDMHTVMKRPFEDYTQRQLRTRSVFFRALYRTMRYATAVVTGNLWNIYLTDFAVVIQRPERSERVETT